MEKQTGEFPGRVFVMEREVYRSHQICRGMWVRVKIEEWDEGVHARNEEVIMEMAWDEGLGSYMGADEGKLLDDVVSEVG